MYAHVDYANTFHTARLTALVAQWTTFLVLVWKEHYLTSLSKKSKCQ